MLNQRGPSERVVPFFISADSYIRIIIYKVDYEFNL